MDFQAKIDRLRQTPIKGRTHQDSYLQPYYHDQLFGDCSPSDAQLIKEKWSSGQRVIQLVRYGTRKSATLTDEPIRKEYVCELRAQPFWADDKTHGVVVAQWATGAFISQACSLC